MNIIELLKKNSEKAPDKIALIHKGEKVTYRDLNERSEKVARFFTGQGLYPNQKALLFIPLSVELYVIFLGLIRIGVTIVLIDPSVGKSHLEKCIKAIEPDAFIATPKAHLLRFIAAVGNIPKKFSTHWVPGSKAIRYLGNEGKKYEDFDTASDHPALITFTSGSTGLPKGISRSHSFLINQHKAISHSLISEDSDVELNTLPVFILSNLASGITTVIPDTDIRNPASVDAKQIVKQVQADGVNRILAAPAFCKNLVDYLESKKQCLDDIKRVYTGGGPVFPNLLKQLSEQLPNAEIVTVYGSTEAEPIAHVSMNGINEQLLEKMQQGSGLLAGKPISEITLAIIPDKDGFPIGPFTNEEFNKFTLSAMDHGEIVVTGNHVQKLYISGDGGKTKFKVENTIWHRTGDAGYLDTLGNLWLLGRCAAKIIKGSKTIYPFGMEAAAMSFSEVRKAAFVEINGMTILAIETEHEDNQPLCQKIKSSVNSVDSVRVIKKIPLDKRHNSKVLYPELKKMLSVQ